MECSKPTYRATAITFNVRFPELIVNGPLYLNVVSLPPTFGCMWLGLEPSVVKKILHSGVPVKCAIITLAPCHFQIHILIHSIVIIMYHKAAEIQTQTHIQNKKYNGLTEPFLLSHKLIHTLGLGHFIFL